MNTKKNRQPFLRRGFVISWMIGTTMTWIVGMILAFILMVGVFIMMAGGEDVLSETTGMSIILYVLILPAGVMMGLSQQSTLKEHLGLNVSHWWWVTALSWSIGLFLAVNIVTTLEAMLFPNLDAPQWFTIIWITIVTAVPAYAQSWLLSKHLSQTWVYALAGIVAGLICGAVLRDQTMSFWVFAPIIFGGLSATVLMWLTSPTTGKMSVTDKVKPN